MLATISYPPIPIFHWGPLALSLHGVFAALGFLAGAWLATRYMVRKGLDAEAYQSALTWGLVGAIIGARLFTLPAHFGDPDFGIATIIGSRGTFSIMGGFAGGILAGAWRMRKVGLPVLQTLDASAPGLALGAVVGRIGDLAIVEHLGKPTDFFLGYAVKAGYDLAPQHNGLECAGPEGMLCGVYHHAAMYDLFGSAVLVGLLIFALSRGWDGVAGRMFFAWVAWYGFQRFLIDFLRFGSGDATLGSFTWNQISGLTVSVVAIFIMMWLRFRRTEPVTVSD